METNNKNYTIEGLFTSELVNKFPELKSTIQDSLDMFDISDIKSINNGYTTIYGDIGFYTFNKFESKDIKFVKDIFDFMESGFDKSETIKTAITTGFEEAILNRITNDSDTIAIIGMMGLKMQNYAKAYINS
jgi:hypothetical protein